MMINKKGLSNIIATVLIILLALAAVVIVWQFVRPTISNSGQNVQLQNQCLDAVVEPVSCIFSDTNSPIISLNTLVVVKQSQGNLKSIESILEFADGTNNIMTQNAQGVFSSQNFNYEAISKVPTQAKATGIVVSDSDATKTQTCEPSTAVACKYNCGAPAQTCLTDDAGYAGIYGCTNNPCGFNLPNGCKWDAVNTKCVNGP